MPHNYDKEIIKKVKMKPGKELKEKFDKWLNENVNIPAKEAGHPDIGAGIAAALSSAGELLIPEDIADLAMAAIPGAKVAKAGKKGYKIIKGAINKTPDKVVPVAEKIIYKKIPVERPKPHELDYKKIREKEIEKARKNQRTLRYNKDGSIDEIIGE